MIEVSSYKSSEGVLDIKSFEDLWNRKEIKIYTRRKVGRDKHKREKVCMSCKRSMDKCICIEVDD